MSVRPYLSAQPILTPVLLPSMPLTSPRGGLATTMAAVVGRAFSFLRNVRFPFLRALFSLGFSMGRKKEARPCHGRAVLIGLHPPTRARRKGRSKKPGRRMFLRSHQPRHEVYSVVARALLGCTCCFGAAVILLCHCTYTAAKHNKKGPMHKCGRPDRGARVQKRREPARDQGHKIDSGFHQRAFLFSLLLQQKRPNHRGIDRAMARKEKRHKVRPL